jgi:tetratricopeptide (TPR) repeat protein
MSRVFLAEETALGRKVVVKVLPPELVAGVNVDRFRREIQLAARLQQAQIVPVLSAGELDGVPYYTMPFVEGESLRAKVARGGALPINDVVNILRDVTRALGYAHEHGVVHRDIKPDNVLLSGGTAVVTDFGIAKALAAAQGSDRAEIPDSSLTQLGVSVGTPAYISPEQAAGDPNIDHRSDIYSLGCMAYELLSGRAPFAGRAPQRTLAAHLTEMPEPIATIRPEIPPALAELVTRCLAKDPGARPQSAAEIAAALDALTTNTSGTVTATFLTGPGATRRALMLYALAFAAVGLLSKAAVVALGLPEWVFTGAVAVMALGLPVVLVTASGKSRHLTWRRTFRAGTIAVGSFAAAVVAIMVLRLFGVGPAASLLAAGKLHDRERLLVIDFNAGQDSSLSHVVTEAVRTNLGQSKIVSIMPPTAVAAALRRMERPATTQIDLALARDIAVREGVKAIVAGNVTPLGTGYVVSVRLVSADSGADLAAYRKTVNGPSDLLDAIDDLTRKLRGRIGESLKSVRDAPGLDQVTTRSLDALRKYAEANRAFDLQGDYVRAAQLLREAVALDTAFAMAYRKLGVALSNSGMPRAQVDSALTRAYQFSDRLPEKEKYLTIATYYQTGPGLDRQKAAEAFQQALSIDSTDLTAAVNLANNYRSRRQFARAESLYASVNASPRTSQVSIANHAGTLLADGKVAQSESVFKELSRRFPAALSAQVAPAVFLYVRGQLDSAESFWKGRRSTTDVIGKLNALSNLSNYAVLRGRLTEARSLARELRDLNARRGVPANPIADSVLGAAIQIWFLEQPDKGVRALDAALAQTPLRSLPIEQRDYFTIATFYSWAGRPDKARALLAQYDAEVREPQYRRNLEPSRHAALAQILMAEKKPIEAVAELWKADSLPDGPATDCTHCMDIDLGRAFDLANQRDSAIFYWERYLGDPSVRAPGRDAIILAGIHKRLGELYEAKNDLPRAISHYAAFVDLWKNADPELQPKVQGVQRRLETLQKNRKTG